MLKAESKLGKTYVDFKGDETAVLTDLVMISGAVILDVANKKGRKVEDELNAYIEVLKFHLSTLTSL